jgi:hypothetical protein
VLTRGIWRGAIAASWLGLACSSSSNAPPSSGAHDASADTQADRAADGTVEAGEAGPAGCGDSTETTTLLGDGFQAWDGLGVLGCLNPADPMAADVKCDDAEVTDGSFTVLTSVCTGHQWDVHIFDGSRGLDCLTTSPPIGGVYTVTPDDCTCASPGRAPSNGCAGGTDGGADASPPDGSSADAGFNDSGGG